jgi:small subunit ribosomal protein S16
MAIRIRLRRVGRRGKRFYRIVVADQRSARNGRSVEVIGYYNPLVDPAEVRVDVEKARSWLARGATPTETVRSLLRRAGVLRESSESRTGSSA